jgi:hypothetical protein
MTPGNDRQRGKSTRSSVVMCWDYRVMRRMPQLYRNGELVVVIDCPDLARSARFWSGVLGFTAGRVTGGPYRSLVPESGEGIEVLLQQVREGKCRKNRLHLDLRTADLETEVRRFLGLGAT